MSELGQVPHIDRRIPVITPDTNPDITQINRQWGLVTEAVRRSLITSKPARDALLQFTTTPVSETLPLQMIATERLIDPMVAGLAKRYDEELGSYLAIPPVPDDQISPDITHTQILENPDQATSRLREIYGDSSNPLYLAGLRDKINSGRFNSGITREEQLLIAKRYAFSRDVKLLALGAEIVDQGTGVKPDENGEIALPSGIKIVLGTKQPDAISDLLSPHLWEKRTQIKDRVYEIYVNGRRYLLKEKKTARHTDTKKTGHKDGVMSAGEFEIARDFDENGNRTDKDVSVGWEKPIGFATFPDGFQFVVFEYEDGLIPDKDIHLTLAQEIIDRREAFEQEYQQIAEKAQSYINDPRVASFFRDAGGGRVDISQHLEEQGSQSELTFEEFALVRAYDMERRATDLMEKVVYQLNYTNNDLYGFSYRINTGKNGVNLEIIGFDFEYFSKISQQDAESGLRVREQWKALRLKEGLNILEWNNSGYPITKMQRGAYLALTNQEVQEASEKK